MAKIVKTYYDIGSIFRLAAVLLACLFAIYFRMDKIYANGNYMTAGSGTMLENEASDDKVGVVAAEVSGKCGENIVWKLDRNGVLSFNGTGPMYDEYSEYFDEDHDLTFHMPEWLDYAKTIRTVVISEGITTICSCAFSGCTWLESVEIPSTVREIGHNAFEECESLTSATIPEGVSVLKYGMFHGCISLTDVYLPSTLEKIGSGAFSYCCQLEHISIPANVSVIGNSFYNCTNLKSIVIPSKLKKISDSCFRECSSLESVVIENGVKKISENAFYECTKLRTVSIPASIKEIDGEAFYGCTGIQEFNVESGNKYFSSESGILFDAKKLKLLQYPCSKAGAEYRIPDGITVIGESAFNNCTNLIQIVLPASVTEIEEDAFSECENLVQINIPSHVEKIGKSAFFGCSALGSIVIPEGVAVLERYTFHLCESLVDVQLPSSLISVEESAFENCKALACIKLPEGVEHIGDNAFLFCKSLKEVHIPSKRSYIFPLATTIPQSAAIYGYQGSTAQDYAKYYGHLFVDLSTGSEKRYVVDNACLFSFLPTDMTSSELSSMESGQYGDGEGHLVGLFCDVVHYDQSSHKYQELKDFTDKLVSMCGTDMEKVSTIMEWVHGHVSYEYGWADTDPYHVFINREGNCMSYTALTGYMLYLADIPVAAVLSADHQWNAALVDGSWINVDSTNGYLKTDPNNMPEINYISFSSMGLNYIIGSGEGVYLAGIGYDDEDAKTYESITIPDYVAGIYRHAISQYDAFVVNGSSGSYAEQYMAGIYDCIAHNGSSFTAHRSHEYKGGKCSFCGLAEKIMVPTLQSGSKTDKESNNKKKIAAPEITVGIGNQSLCIKTIKNAKIKLTTNQGLFQGKKSYTGYTGGKKELNVPLTKKINKRTKIKIKITKDNYKSFSGSYTFT